MVRTSKIPFRIKSTRALSSSKSPNLIVIVLTRLSGFNLTTVAAFSDNVIETDGEMYYLGMYGKKLLTCLSL